MSLSRRDPGHLPACENTRRKSSICELPHTPRPNIDGSLIRERNRCDVGGAMEMHQIRYFLALCEERSFTRAARRCGISQPSLTNAIIRLEQQLGGALFKRKPAIALTMLGHALHPYLRRIAENADHARNTAQALVNVQLADQGTGLTMFHHESREKTGWGSRRPGSHYSVEAQEAQQRPSIQNNSGLPQGLAETSAAG